MCVECIGTWHIVFGCELIFEMNRFLTVANYNVPRQNIFQTTSNAFRKVTHFRNGKKFPKMLTSNFGWCFQVEFHAYSIKVLEVGFFREHARNLDYFLFIMPIEQGSFEMEFLVFVGRFATGEVIEKA